MLLSLLIQMTVRFEIRIDESEKDLEFVECRHIFAHEEKISKENETLNTSNNRNKANEEKDRFYDNVNTNHVDCQKTIMVL